MPTDAHTTQEAFAASIDRRYLLVLTSPVSGIQLMIMDIERPDDGFSLESLGEDPREIARSQLAVLEKSLESCREPAQTAALIDEAYRAAHSLKSAVDPMRMPNVDRLARRVQEVVRLARSGAIPVTLELGAVLASIARVARDALEMPQGPEPLSAASAAATLEEMLEHPTSWSAPPGLLNRPFNWSKVEAGRLDAAGEAARVARSAFSAFQRAAVESTDVVERFRSALVEHQRALEALRQVIPRAMGAAARGEPTAAAASELGETVSRLAGLASDLDLPLSRTASAVKEAAVQGGRAADTAEAAFSSLTCVRLDALLEELPRVVRRAAKAAGTSLELAQEPTNVEVIASRAETVRTLITRTIRAVVGALPAGKTPSRRARGERSRNAHPHGARLSLFARSAGDSLYLRIAVAGATPNVQKLKDSLSKLQRPLAKEGAGAEAEAKKGEGASILLTVRSAAAVTSRTAEFLFARAGTSWYAVPSSAVVECVDGGLSMSEYVLDGVRVPTLRMNDTRDPRQAVIVKTPRGGAALLFDEVGTREAGLQTAGSGDGPHVAGIAGSVRRPDGTSTMLLDLTVLLPAPR